MDVQHVCGTLAGHYGVRYTHSRTSSGKHRFNSTSRIRRHILRIGPNKKPLLVCQGGAHGSPEIGERRSC